ncbi:EGFR adapter protein-like [Condylostylus longicornis]|uniref:EGFR adapter protein-like n=1 Tax=Condylostylus longicornis TaxID=2530218 RepID=UPI00244E1E76|nr:EGFR adapter protein-like [Condylostylus longicornis]
MKDFLRKKFNTLTPTSSRKETTTTGSSLHEEDIYVEFPNCLLKVINNNLGSQNHKETLNHNHQNHQNHNQQQHQNNQNQNYQTDIKKLSKYPQQQQQQQVQSPHKQNQHQQQQHQHYNKHQPSGSLDNNIKRFDVMQDVRIRLEQLHKQQQQQQQHQHQQNQTQLLQQQQQNLNQNNQNFHFQQNFQFQQQQQQQNHLHNNHNNHNNQNNQNQNNHNNTPTHHHHHNQNHGSPNISNNITPRHRPIHLFSTTANLNTNGNEPPPHSPSSEEDNSPTEMNNCRRLVDKPPLVKRITMGLFGLTEDSRPLVHAKPTTLNNEQQLQQQQLQLQQQQQQQQKQHLGSTTTIDGYVNEGICEPEKIISSKFGDSCRQSLTAISTLDTNQFLDNSEFNFKKKYMRETCSANSSPRIFGPSALLKNKGGLSPTEQIELKGAAWFQAGISREIAVEILSSQSPGSFLVRQSNTKSDCFVLSVRVPPPAPKVAHYLILRTIRGYKIKGFTKEFTSLRALITHHSVMPELLPVPLALPRPATCTPRRRNVDDFESYGSLRLLGILNMMQSNHNFDRENNS